MKAYPRSGDTGESFASRRLHVWRNMAVQIAVFSMTRRKRTERLSTMNSAVFNATSGFPQHFVLAKCDTSRHDKASYLWEEDSVTCTAGRYNAAGASLDNVAEHGVANTDCYDEDSRKSKINAADDF